MQNVRHTACQQRGGQGFVFTQGPASKYIPDCNISHCNYSVEDKIADKFATVHAVAANPETWGRSGSTCVAN